MEVSKIKQGGTHANGYVLAHRGSLMNIDKEELLLRRLRARELLRSYYEGYEPDRNMEACAREVLQILQVCEDYECDDEIRIMKADAKNIIEMCFLLL